MRIFKNSQPTITLTSKVLKVVLHSLCILTALSALSSDLQRGIVFSPTEHVTADKIHRLIDDTTINTTFATDLSVAQPAASDVFPFVQPGTPIWRKTTYRALIEGITNIITAELDAPATNDFVYVLDTSAGTLAKVPLQSIFTNAWWISGLPDYTNLPYGAFSYPYVSNGVPYRIEHSNLFAGWWQWEPLSTNAASTIPQTNPYVLSVHTSPTNTDAFVLWSAVGQTNKVMTLAGFTTNRVTAGPGLTNSDLLDLFSTRTNNNNQFGTNPIVAKITLADLFTNYVEVPAGTVTNNDTLLIFSTATNAFAQSTGTVAKVKMSSIIQKFYTNGIPLSGTGFQVNGQHGLGGTPQIVKWYLMQTNSGGDASYLQGDIVPVEAFESSANAVVFAGGANSTNVFLTMRTTTPQVCTKAGATLTGITLSKWNAVCEAIYYP